MDKRTKLRIILAGAGLLGASVPAHAQDWFQVSSDNSGCTDITATQTAAGDPQLGTPDGTASLYQSLGDNVASTTLHDNAGAQIIFQHITDSSGNPFLNFTFFPSLPDCQAFLSYLQAHRHS